MALSSSASLIVDVLILGSGPAGLAAALALARHSKSALVFNNNITRNGISAHMHMLPTWDHKDSKDFRAASREELLTRYKTISFQDANITQVAGGQNLFTATDDKGSSWQGRRVLLAHGVKDIMPEDEFPGYTACWGQGIYHCLFCHGYEERGASSAGVLAWGSFTARHAREVSRQARNLAQKVTIYTHGSSLRAEEVRELNPGLRVSVDTRKIVRLERVDSTRHSGSEIVLHFEDGGSKHEGFLAHAPYTELAGPFANQLGCEILPDKVHIKVESPFPETTVKGIFAAGDITSPAPSVINALQGGMMAGVGLVSSLSNIEDEEGNLKEIIRI